MRYVDWLISVYSVVNKANSFHGNGRVRNQHNFKGLNGLKLNAFASSLNKVFLVH